MRILKLFLLVLIAFSSRQVYADIGEENGNDWLKLNEQSRVYYITGFVNGSGYVVGNNNFKLQRSDEVAVAHKEVMSSITVASKTKTKVCLNVVDVLNYSLHERGLALDIKADAISKYSIPKITIRTLLDGLESFYNDFKNRNIKISDAIYVVKKQVNGDSPVAIENIILYLRSNNINYLGNPFGGYTAFP